MPSSPHHSNEPLARILARVDVWRGFKDGHQIPPCSAGSSGFNDLDNNLRGSGWPSDGLIDLALQHYGNEWFLWLPWLQKQMQMGQTIALINPPWLPYATSLISAGLMLDQLLIVTPQSHGQWLASWRDIAKANVCSGVLAWTPALSYPELRKCHLLAADHDGLYAIHRPWMSQRQHSPAVLRMALRWQPAGLHCQLLKQKGTVAGQQFYLPPPPALAPLWQTFGHQQVNGTQPKTNARAKVYPAEQHVQSP